MSPVGEPVRGDESAVETPIARVLFIGGLLSLAIVLVGFTLSVVSGTDALREAHFHARRELTGQPPRVFVSLADLIHAVSRWPPEPFAVMTLGLGVLLLTPVVGVVTALIAFAREPDRDYVVISAVVLGLLAVSFVLVVVG